jgi:hypothetical protein
MNANWLLAWTCRGLGEDDRAAALDEVVLEQARTLGNRDMLSMLLSGGRAHRAIDEGRAADAITMLEEACDITRERGDLWRLTHVASGVAHALASLGQPTAATRVLASERALFRQIGGTPPGHLAKEDEKTLSLIYAQLDDEAFDEAWQAGAKLSADKAIALALAAGETTGTQIDR